MACDADAGRIVDFFIQNRLLPSYTQLVLKKSPPEGRDFSFLHFIYFL